MLALSHLKSGGTRGHDGDVTPRRAKLRMDARDSLKPPFRYHNDNEWKYMYTTISDLHRENEVVQAQQRRRDLPPHVDVENTAPSLYTKKVKM